MNQEIEIEFKNLLTRQEFEYLKEHFSIEDTQFTYQENHYFDTFDFALKKKGCALRIRKKSHAFEMTLKQPLEEGLLETNETLTDEEAKLMIENKTFPKKDIEKLLKNELQILPAQIEYFGKLSTNRAETNYKDGLIVLDHSTYLNKEDFEIEYEVANYATGKNNFTNLLETLNIPIRKTDNKIKRFYNEKFKK